MKKKLLFALLSLLLLPIGVIAQNVSIGPKNGSFITGKAGGNTQDSGWRRGMASLWRHEQLALTMTTSDIANLTSAGELADPSNAIDSINLKKINRNNPNYPDETRLLLGAGSTQTFIVVSLPKGYRITGYRLVLQPNVYGNIQLHDGKNSWNIGTNDSMCFYETPAWSKGSPYGENTHSNTLECADAIAVATEVDGTNTVMKNATPEDRAKEYVITRTADDMTNQLHFFFAAYATDPDYAGCPSQYAVTVKSFMIYFTAEGTFESEISPVTPGPAVSMVKSPFTTSKMDLGSIQYDNTAKQYYYSFEQTRNLKAYSWLYQSDAVQAGKPKDIATKKHIYPLEIDGKGVFAFGKGEYYVEPPTTIMTASGWESPIGFRVIGAKFRCQWGRETNDSPFVYDSICKIRVQYNNNYYYLNDNLDFIQSNNENNAFAWKVDTYGNLYTGTGEYKQYLACFGESEEERIISLGAAATGGEAKWNLKIDNENHLYYTDSQNHKFVLNYQRRQEGDDYHLRGYVTVGATNDLATARLSGRGTVTLPGYHPGAYTLNIYDKTGQSILDSIRVTKAGTDSTYTLLGLNNDAVRFSITNMDSTKQAMVTVTLMLQALNPYVDRMNVVCHDPLDQFTLTRSFTSNDFRVAGGYFIFYVPIEKRNKELTITFSDLYSHYGDSTYYDGETSGNARYNYVTSEYYKNNPDLYHPSGDVDDYTRKVYASSAGNQRFKFNNAEDVSAGRATTLQEYQFDYSKYTNGGYFNPDTIGSTWPSDTIPCIMLASSDTRKSATYYVFTSDETRYNIAPTDSLQHRFYAFYRMDIELRAEEFTPDFRPTQVYASTCYENDSINSMWGVKLLTTRKVTIDDGQGGTKETYGYLSAQQIVDSLKALKQCKPEQLLYIDASELLSVVELGDTAISHIKTLLHLGDNVLTYFPLNQPTNPTLNNFAYMTEGGAFLAGSNIVLVDKQPFFAPYDIQVDAAKYATYTRKITVQKNGKVANATVMLPFTLRVDRGVHTNPTDENFPGSGQSFTVNTLASDTIIAKDTNGHGDCDHGIAYFKPINGLYTEANKPYMIKVISDTGDDQISFIATQKGSTINRTLHQQGTDGYIHTGELLAGGTSTDISFAGQEDLVFTNYGSYSGARFTRNNNKIFYFANNQYLSMTELISNRPYLYIYPFRGVYAYTVTSTTPGGNGSRNFSLKHFDISYDEPDFSDITGINDRSREADLIIRTSKGSMTLTSTKAQQVSIYSINGIRVAKANMQGGDTQTINLPMGVYLVNDVKIAVK